MTFSPFPNQSNYNGYQNGMRETIVLNTQQTVRRLPKPLSSAESTKDRKEYKLPVVRKTTARELSTNRELKGKNCDPKRGKTR